MISRREALTRIGTAAGVATLTPRFGSAQTPQPSATQGARKIDPPSVISNPPRDFSQPVTYPDPDIITIDPAFNALRVGNTPIQRLWTGAMWCEGPAWNGQGRYLIWSDIPNNRQMRWIEEDGRITVFRQPSGNSNGNTFDHQGRQLSCEHSGRRVVRYEHDGSITVIADSFQGKRLNSPNDIACHTDGSYWFTDPPYGGSIYEGMPDAAGGPSNQQGQLNAKVGQPAGSGVLKRELSCNVYRVDPTGRVDMVISEEALGGIPNGITFSPDYKRLYVVNRGQVSVLDVGAGHQVSAPRQFADFMADGIRCGTDGIRADVFGNLWASSNAGANVGYSGVTVWNSAGKLIGRIRLPEVCANVTFGGPKRNRLFMAAGQSLYAVYTNTQGSSPG
jgi:gluconolactonase